MSAEGYEKKPTEESEAAPVKRRLTMERAVPKAKKVCREPPVNGNQPEQGIQQLLQDTAVASLDGAVVGKVFQVQILSLYIKLLFFQFGCHDKNDHKFCWKSFLRLIICPLVPIISIDHFGKPKCSTLSPKQGCQGGPEVSALGPWKSSGALLKFCLRAQWNPQIGELVVHSRGTRHAWGPWKFKLLYTAPLNKNVYWEPCPSNMTNVVF